MFCYATCALLYILAVTINNVVATGNIGCLFSETLCNPEKEWCYNDFAFGKCLSLYGSVHQNDLRGIQFGAKDLQTLEKEMQRLFLLGYRWSHAYTQCVLQAALFSIKNRSDLDISSCDNELDQDLEGTLKAIEGEEMEQIDPRNLAIVRFTPSVADPHSDYADELYYPPLDENGSPVRTMGPSKEPAEGDEEAKKDEGKKEKDQNKDEKVEKGKEHHSTAKTPVPPTATPLRFEETKFHSSDFRPGDFQSPRTSGFLNDLPQDSANADEEPEVLPYLPMDEIPDDQVFLPDYPQERVGLPPPAIPMAMYLDREEEEPTAAYDKLTENDYDYDLLFHSPYATRPRITALYKRNGGTSGFLDPRDRREGGVDALVGNLFGKSSNAGDLRKLAKMLNSLRPMDRGIDSKPRVDYTNGELMYMPPAEPEPTRNFNGQRFLTGNIGYFQDRPILPHFRERPHEQAPFYSSYERDYNSQYYNQKPNPQIPELEPPKPVDEANLSPDTMHPPYIKSDYEETPLPKTFENGVSRFDMDSKPIIGGMGSKPHSYSDSSQDSHSDSYHDWKKQHWMMADESQAENPDSDLKDPRKDYRPTFENHQNTMAGAHLPPDTYYGRPAYPAYSFGAYDYRDYPIYYDYGADYSDMGAPPPWNFHRDERLDVKKPGPFFKSQNDFAFDYKTGDDYVPGDNNWMGGMEPMEGESLLLEKLRESQGLTKDGNKLTDGKNQEQVPDLLLTEEGYVDAANDESARHHLYQGFPKAAFQVAPKTRQREKGGKAPEKEKEPDTFVYITINGKFHSQKEGEQMVHLILHLRGLDMKDIQYLKVDESQVMFQLVPKNAKGETANHLADSIKELRNAIKEKTGMDIIQAGVGTKSSLSSVVYSSGERQMLAAAAIVCGVCAALLVAATTLFFLRRHSRSKAKLQGIAAHDSEASKDYQDLCRARMAGKGDGKDGLSSGPGHAHPVGTGSSGHAPGQRISSLSKESENGNSPSSRSSTSSWSEEPVMSNMDISTGHMVLSYMEDHLRNKDRLEQEWVALCAYEAEPCATNLALKPENAQKNRYPDILPYDHNRVVLNEHANVSGSSYINASSITDHDPRNPAYIATQGPLASTAADFWQLVWEQGSVVIVMLTRLTENGQALCHRYWPEEGSELYHIYEVHLVSEHIWCDDYLVRSFYLKNVRTGETRTVTQFHFLSWPESGIPASTKALLEFRRKVNKSYRGRSCPIIVNCSDGVGRTGTYCLIDMVLNRMSKGAKEIDIAATLEHIRDQRPNMVKTKAQFEFVLMSVAEEVHAILKALPQ